MANDLYEAVSRHAGLYRYVDGNHIATAKLMAALERVLYFANKHGKKVENIKFSQSPTFPNLTENEKENSKAEHYFRVSYD